MISSRGRQNDGYGRGQGGGAGRDNNYRSGGDDRPLRRNDNNAPAAHDSGDENGGAATDKAPREPLEARMPKYKEPTSTVSRLPIVDSPAHELCC